MSLHGEGVIAVEEGRILAEAVARDHLGPNGRLDHLVAVPGVQHDPVVAELVGGGAHGPALVRPLHPAAQGLRHDLVAEADAHQRHPRIAGLADESFERRDEGVLLVDAMARAGDEPAVAVVDACGELHVEHAVGAEREPIPVEQATEHVGIVPHLSGEDVGRFARLQDADQHELSELSGPESNPGPGQAARGQTVSR